jgi:hypothetical protein
LPNSALRDGEAAFFMQSYSSSQYIKATLIKPRLKDIAALWFVALVSASDA